MTQTQNMYLHMSLINNYQVQCYVLINKSKHYFSFINILDNLFPPASMHSLGNLSNNYA